MLDTYARKYVEPHIGKVADFFIRRAVTPNQVSGLAFAVGLGSGLATGSGLKLTAVGLLWLSGLFDTVDGSMARRLRQTSPWGTLIDITFDRIVEISVILGLGYLYPLARFHLMLLLAAIIVSMTVFLTVGALSKNTGSKSFYYQAGLAERTEGFIMSSLMILFPGAIIPLTLIYAGAIIFTAGQRFLEARRILNTRK